MKTECHPDIIFGWHFVFRFRNDKSFNIIPAMEIKFRT